MNANLHLKTDHRDSHGQCRRMCASYNTPERDQLNKEDVDQPEQCLLYGQSPQAFFNF